MELAEELDETSSRDPLQREAQVETGHVQGVPHIDDVRRLELLHGVRLKRLHGQHVPHELQEGQFDYLVATDVGE